QCLAILDRLEPGGLVITKHGKPVARVLPIPRKPEEMIGSLKDEIKVLGDILSTGLDWEADAQP
ncbi:MAG: type II toxin-antitoxin system Phd/YefM family antitoxin, partial [Rhodothermia bacterium]